MIPGKKYKPEDLLRIAWRLRWLIVTPFVAVALGTIITVQLLPNRYRSEILILVVPQRIPESYVQSTVTSRIEDRLQSISQQILGRTRLERIIRDLDLYAEERATVSIENTITRMRKNITVDTVKGDSFRVSYISTDPRAAMRVTERLASLFIEENLRDREVLAEGTNQFMESQLDDARRHLVEQEKKVEAYRRQYTGELPSQLDSNLQVLQSTQLQVQAAVESINRDRDQLLMLERSIADLPDETSESFSQSPSAGGSSGRRGTTAEQLAAARASLNDMQERLTPRHPDIVRMKRTIRELEKQADAASAPRLLTLEEIARRQRLRELKAQHDTLDRQIASKQAEERRLRDVIATYQARVEAVPTRESEMIALTRDYNTLQQVYASLLEKREASKVAANLERRQIGQQFRVLDPAREPQEPFSPNRPRITLLGALFGLALGVGLAALIEYRDSSLRTDEDVTSVLSLPVVAMIPKIMTTDERSRLKRQRLIIGASVMTVLGLYGVALVWAIRL